MQNLSTLNILQFVQGWGSLVLEVITVDAKYKCRSKENNIMKQKFQAMFPCLHLTNCPDVGLFCLFDFNPYVSVFTSIYTICPQTGVGFDSLVTTHPGETLIGYPTQVRAQTGSRAAPARSRRRSENGFTFSLLNSGSVHRTLSLNTLHRRPPFF